MRHKPSPQKRLLSQKHSPECFFRSDECLHILLNLISIPPIGVTVQGVKEKPKPYCTSFVFNC